MKTKLITLTILLTVFFGAATMEMKASKYVHDITIDPVSFLFGHTLYASYEQQIAATNSFTAFLGYYSLTAGYWSYSNITIGGSYRWYVKLFDDKKKPFEGLSCGPFAAITIVSSTAEYGNAAVSGSYFTVGGEAAYKWLFDQWVVEPVIRIGFGLNKVSGFNDYSTVGGGLNLGYAF